VRPFYGTGRVIRLPKEPLFCNIPSFPFSTANSDSILLAGKRSRFPSGERRAAGKGSLLNPFPLPSFLLPTPKPTLLVKSTLLPSMETLYVSFFPFKVCPNEGSPEDGFEFSFYLMWGILKQQRLIGIAADPLPEPGLKEEFSLAPLRELRGV